MSEAVAARCVVCEDDFYTWEGAVDHARSMRHRIEREKVEEDGPTSCYRCEPMSLVPPPVDNFFQHLEDVHGISRAVNRKQVNK